MSCVKEKHLRHVTYPWPSSATVNHQSLSSVHVYLFSVVLFCFLESKNSKASQSVKHVVYSTALYGSGMNLHCSRLQCIKVWAQSSSCSIPTKYSMVRQESNAMSNTRDKGRCPRLMVGCYGERCLL